MSKGRIKKRDKGLACSAGAWREIGASIVEGLENKKKKNFCDALEPRDKRARKGLPGDIEKLKTFRIGNFTVWSVKQPRRENQEIEG